MFIDELMLKKFLNCTVTDDQSHKAARFITIEMLEALSALKYAWGIYDKEYSSLLTFFGVRFVAQPFSKTQCLNLLVKKLESYCDSISRAHDLVTFGMTGSSTSETFLTDLR